MTTGTKVRPAGLSGIEIGKPSGGGAISSVFGRSSYPRDLNTSDASLQVGNLRPLGHL